MGAPLLSLWRWLAATLSLVLSVTLQFPPPGEGVMAARQSDPTALPLSALPLAVCGTACSTDRNCPDSTGVCTYCRAGICQPPAATCGTPQPALTQKPQFLMIGDSVSMGIQQAGRLFSLLPAFESQHVPVNAGPAKKGWVIRGVIPGMQ